MELIQQLFAAHPGAVTLACAWLFYIGFVVYAGMLPAIKERRWGLVLLSSPILIPFGIVDVLLSPVVGVLVFHELRFHWTISERLSSHYTEHGKYGDRARYLGARINWILPSHIG